MLIFLPTNGVVLDFHEKAVELDILDYDLDEYIRMCLDALVYVDWYPDSFENAVALDVDQCPNPEFVERFEKFNVLLKMLYDRIYSAMIASRAYMYGSLVCPYFCVYNNDIVISDEEISSPLGDQQW